MRDLLKFRTQEHKVKVLNNEISAFRSKEITKTGARIFTPEGLVASAASVGEVSDGALYERCLGNRDAALLAEAVPSGTHKQNWSSNIEKGATAESALELAREHVDFLSSQLPDFLAQGQIITLNRSWRYQNELGADLAYSYEASEFTYDIRRKGSANIADGFFGHEDLLGASAKEDLAFTVELFQKFDRDARIQPGRHKVLMLPEGTTLGKLSESLRADLYSEGTSLYSKRLGERIFSEKFSLFDLRNVPERGAFTPFDFEGMVAKNAKLPLLEKGMIRALVSDLKNEKRHGIASTANGFRSYNSSIKLGFGQLGIEPGNRSWREILREAGEVIVSFMAYGGDLTAQGDFSTPVQMAFLSRNGEIVGKLPALSMSSHLERMYGGDLIEVAANGPYKNSSQPFLLCEMDIQVI